MIFCHSQWQLLTKAGGRFGEGEDALFLTLRLKTCTRRTQVSIEKRGRFGSWGPSSLFRHSLFSLSKNTSEAASLPAHGASEFHSILLSAIQTAWSTVHQGKRMCAQTHTKCHSWGKRGTDTFNYNTERNRTGKIVTMTFLGVCYRYEAKGCQCSNLSPLKKHLKAQSIVQDG